MVVLDEGGAFEDDIILSYYSRTVNLPLEQFASENVEVRLSGIHDHGFFSCISYNCVQ